METFTNNQAIQQFIDANNTFFEDVIDAIEKSEKERLENDYFKFNEKQRRFEKYCLVYDIIKTLGKFVKTDDIFIASYLSRNAGRTEFNSAFTRNGINFQVKTQVIDAGGYNIQRYHLRYLSHCTLKEKRNPKTDLFEIKEKIKKFTKEQKLQKEIEAYEQRIVETSKNLSRAESMNDEQIHEELLLTDKHYLQMQDWKWSGGERFNNDFEGRPFHNEETFNLWMKQNFADSIQRWKNWNIDSNKRYLKSYNKELTKLKTKLEKLQGAS